MAQFDSVGLYILRLGLIQSPDRSTPVTTSMCHHHTDCVYSTGSCHNINVSSSHRLCVQHWLLSHHQCAIITQTVCTSQHQCSIIKQAVCTSRHQCAIITQTVCTALAPVTTSMCHCHTDCVYSTVLLSQHQCAIVTQTVCTSQHQCAFITQTVCTVMTLVTS